MLNDSSDVSRCEPANCSVSRSANEKPKPWTRPNAEASHHATAAVHGSASTPIDDVLERHVDDRHGDQHFDERREPQRVGRRGCRRRRSA